MVKKLDKKSVLYYSVQGENSFKGLLVLSLDENINILRAYDNYFKHKKTAL